MAYPRTKVLKTVLEIIRVLKPAQRKKAYVTVALILFHAAFDVFSLASVLPFVLLFLDASIFQENQLVSVIYHFFGFQNQKQFLLAALVFLLFLFLLKNGVSVLINYFQSRFVYDVATEISQRQFNNFYDKNYLYFTETSSSVPARNILNIPIEYSTYVLFSSISFLSELIVLLLISAGIAIYNFNIFVLLLLIFALPIYLIYRLKKDKLTEIGKISEELKPPSLQRLFEGIKGYVDIKLYQKEGYFTNRFLEVQKSLNRNFALFNTVSLIPQRLIEITAVLGLMAILVYSMFLSVPKSEVIVLLSLFTASAYRLMPSLNRMFISLVNIRTFRYVLGILSEGKGDESIAAASGTLPSERLKFDRQISFQNVSFVYPDQTSFKLKNINLVVKKGDMVGFIGKSGSGKTTLLNLLLRFLEEQSGQILVDDHPLHKEDILAWWNLIGYVKQDPFILDGTIAENIAFGEASSEMDFEKIRTAIRHSGLEEFLDGLSEGINTNIGEQGAKLSGGQRQRIAIARALYRDAEVFLFDEATSELDLKTEQEIVIAIQKLAEQNKTIFIIAHRITTLKRCDRIYELRDGEISSFHKYQELMEKEA